MCESQSSTTEIPIRQDPASDHFCLTFRIAKGIIRLFERLAYYYSLGEILGVEAW